MKKTLFVTGGAGFIGSQFVRLAVEGGYRVVCYDALTYAGHLANLTELLQNDQFQFVKGDIRDASMVWKALQEARPQGIIHFAAESHVDNSIHGPQVFLETNVMGTFQLLEATRRWVKETREPLRFLHVSTDEVFGELGPTGKFSEKTPYAPNSPYSSSKASSDLLARAWHHTYDLDIVITNCSNNYGPRQFPEKLIPRMILSALSGRPLPVYGKGENIRDWIHVEDHSRGVLLAFEKGRAGETYCLGGNSERKNIEVVRAICRLLDEHRPRGDGQSYERQIEFVTDRLGHDFRYAIDDRKAAAEIGFQRRYQNFEEGLAATIQWYLHNEAWCRTISNRADGNHAQL